MQEYKGEDAYLKGNLNYWAKGTINRQWQMRFCVLYANSPKHLGRLDWFKGGEEEYERKPKQRRTVYLEQIANVLAADGDLQQQYVFEVYLRNTKTPLKFAAFNEAERQKWVKDIELLKSEYENLDKDLSNSDEGLSYQNEFISTSTDPGFIYEVSVNETDLSAKLDISGKYLLRIAADSIHLLPIDDINGQGPIFIWPYKFIRRWGCSADSFTFETGRKCETGQGLLNFKTYNSDDIFKKVRDYTKSFNENSNRGELNDVKASSTSHNRGVASRTVNPKADNAAGVSHTDPIYNMATELSRQTSSKQKSKKSLFSRKSSVDEQQAAIGKRPPAPPMSSTPQSNAGYEITPTLATSDAYSEPYSFVKDKATRLASNPLVSIHEPKGEDRVQHSGRSRMADIALGLQVQGPVTVTETSDYATLSVVEGTNKIAKKMETETEESNYGVAISNQFKKSRKPSKS